MPFRRLLIPALAIALLSGCGWQLRGDNLGEVASSTSLVYEANVSGPLEQMFERFFDESADRDAAHYRLVILRESRRERQQTLTVRLHTGILRIEKTLSYRIEELDGERMEAGTAQAWRDMEVEENNPASTEREKQTLTEEINLELLRQLARHLERFADGNQG